MIGQAAEFDYSGTQATKALREEGYEVILVNSNPATIMTDPEIADRTYIEPVTPEFVELIIEREKPDALLPTMGGQTALNVAMALVASAACSRSYGVRADRRRRRARSRSPRTASCSARRWSGSGSASRRAGSRTRSTRRSALLETTGFPAIIRPSFTLGGTRRRHRVQPRGVRGHRAPRPRPSRRRRQVLIERSLLGWKEFELEVMRDRDDNVVIVCSIENLDPMGVHTGDSITVAPAMTLTDREYQTMRDAACAIIREIGVDAGGCNIQFAVNPRDGEMVVIEMNPRVSRSSALASKATGFPIARIGAKLAVGYRLDEIPNDITKTTPASFEPVLDYVVVKCRASRSRSSPSADPRLTTQMKTVGEAMAIGRTFKEAFQKALRALETGRAGVGRRRAAAGRPAAPTTRSETLRGALRQPTPERIFQVKRALSAGMTIEELYELTAIDPWFLEQMQELLEAERAYAALGRSDAARDAPHEADRLLRPAARGRCAATTESEAARAALGARRAAGVQDGRHLRRRVPVGDAVPVRQLRRGERGAAERPQVGRDPRQRPEPDRPGRGVRLLLRARRDGAARAGIRDDHDQLESRDRLDRLRHLGQAVLRAADARGRAGDRASASSRWA